MYLNQVMLANKQRNVATFKKRESLSLNTEITSILSFQQHEMGSMLLRGVHKQHVTERSNTNILFKKQSLNII